MRKSNELFFSSLWIIASSIHSQYTLSLPHENIRLSDGYRKGALGTNGLIDSKWLYHVFYLGYNVHEIHDELCKTKNK